MQDDVLKQRGDTNSSGSGVFYFRGLEVSGIGAILEPEQPDATFVRAFVTESHIGVIAMALNPHCTRTSAEILAWGIVSRQGELAKLSPSATIISLNANNR